MLRTDICSGAARESQTAVGGVPGKLAETITMVMIDGQSFHPTGWIAIEKGSGDSRVRCQFKMLRGPDGRAHWLFEDDTKWWLYGLHRPSEQVVPESVTPVKLHETFSSDKVEAHGIDQQTLPKDFHWVTLSEPVPGGAKLYRESNEALVLGSGSNGWVMPAVPLAHHRSGYYSPTSRAVDVARTEISLEPTSGLSDLKAVGVLAGILSVAFAICAGMDFIFPVQCFWFVAPLIGVLGSEPWKKRPIGRLARLIAGAFLFHLLTRGLDVATTGDWDDGAAWIFEEWKLAAVFAALGLLSKIRPQLYFAIVDGVYFLGYFTFWVGLGVMAGISLDDRFNYFPFFNYYAGSMPWGALLLLVGLGGIAYRMQDYRRVPVDRQGFRSLLYRVIDTLNQGPEVAAQFSNRLVCWADDLEDATSISCSLEVLSLAPLGPDFLRWREQAKSLRDHQRFTEAQRERVKQDLLEVCHDFQETADSLDRLPNTPATFSSLRFSPFLTTWNQ